MTVLKKPIIEAVSAFKFDAGIKTVLDGVYFNNEEVVITDGMTMHIMNNEEDTGLTGRIIHNKSINTVRHDLDKLMPSALVDVQGGSVRIQGVQAQQIDGEFPSYKPILPDETKTSVRLDIDRVIRALQVLKKLGAKGVAIGIRESTQGVLLKALDGVGQAIDHHKVTVVMPMMLDDKNSIIKTESVKGVEIKPEPVKSEEPEINPDEDLPF